AMSESKRFEDGVVPAPIEIIGERNGERRARPGPAVLAQNHDATGIWIWQRSQQHGIDDTEDGGVRADAERNREHGDGSEAGLFGQHSQGKTNILEQRVHLFCAQGNNLRNTERKGADADGGEKRLFEQRAKSGAEILHEAYSVRKATMGS